MPALVPASYCLIYSAFACQPQDESFPEKLLERYVQHHVATFTHKQLPLFEEICNFHTRVLEAICDYFAFDRLFPYLPRGDRHSLCEALLLEARWNSSDKVHLSVTGELRGLGSWPQESAGLINSALVRRNSAQSMDRSAVSDNSSNRSPSIQSSGGSSMRTSFEYEHWESVGDGDETVRVKRERSWSQRAPPRGPREAVPTIGRPSNSVRSAHQDAKHNSGSYSAHHHQGRRESQSSGYSAHQEKRNSGGDSYNPTYNHQDNRDSSSSFNSYCQGRRNSNTSVLLPYQDPRNSSSSFTSAYHQEKRDSGASLAYQYQELASTSFYPISQESVSSSLILYSQNQLDSVGSRYPPYPARRDSVNSYNEQNIRYTPYGRRNSGSSHRQQRASSSSYNPRHDSSSSHNTHLDSHSSYTNTTCYRPLTSVTSETTFSPPRSCPESATGRPEVAPWEEEQVAVPLSHHGGGGERRPNRQRSAKTLLAELRREGCF